MNIDTQNAKMLNAALELLDPKLAALVIAVIEDTLRDVILDEVPKRVVSELAKQSPHLGITAANVWEIYGLPASKRGPAMLDRQLTEHHCDFGMAKVGDSDKWVRVFDPQLVIQAMREGLLEHCKKYKPGPKAKPSKVVQLRPSQHAALH